MLGDGGQTRFQWTTNDLQIEPRSEQWCDIRNKPMQVYDFHLYICVCVWSYCSYVLYLAQYLLVYTCAFNTCMYEGGSTCGHLYHENFYMYMYMILMPN